MVEFLTKLELRLEEENHTTSGKHRSIGVKKNIDRIGKVA
jgi:hypothetical protein